MFNQYEYFTSIIDENDFPEIKTISRVTGLAGLEEAIENIRSISPLVLFIEDDADGCLNLEQGNFDYGFHTFSIVDVCRQGDTADRIRALNACMTAGLKLLKRMLADSRNFNDACYGFDRTRIDYQRIGPLMNNTYGFMFTYIIKNENFTL